MKGNDHRDLAARPEMQGGVKRARGQVAVWMTLVFVGTAAAFISVLPGAREALHYLVAGSLASALTLAVAFGFFVTGRL